MTDRVSAGWQDLEQARWEQARATFAEAASAEGTAAAYEGLSWAAWWLDDEPAVFDARRRAYRLHLDGGDPCGAARMAIWLAVDELDFHGAVPVAQGWLERARRHLEDVPVAPEHGWLAFHDGYLAHLAGDAQRAADLALEASAIGRELGVVDVEMLGIALEGAVLVSRAEVEHGMRRLDAAAAAALEGTAAIPISGAWVCCFLVSACTSVLDFGRAAAWCDRIADFSARYGSRYMLAFCRAEYGAVHLWRGRWPEAEAMLEASVRDFRRSRPAMVGGPLAALAELRRRQGRPREAEELLDAVGTSQNEQLCRARLALDAGDAGAAVGLLQRALRQLPEHGRLARGPLLELLVRAHVARGQLAAARTAGAELRELAVTVGTPAMSAVADLAEGTLAAAAGERARARTLLEDALDGFTGTGASDEAARAREQLAALGHEAPPGPPALPQLTAREREVLALLADGLTNAAIAKRLVVSEHTIHRHVANILTKLGVSSRAAAAAHAVRAGIT